MFEYIYVCVSVSAARHIKLLMVCCFFICLVLFAAIFGHCYASFSFFLLVFVATHIQYVCVCVSVCRALAAP